MSFQKNLLRTASEDKNLIHTLTNIFNESYYYRFGFASFDCGSDTDLAIEIALKGENGTQVDYRTLSEMSRCRHNFVLGLCNDELGYIIPENDFYLHEWLPYFNNAVDESGRKHYEETNSLGPKAAGKILDAMDKLISSVE